MEREKKEVCEGGWEWGDILIGMGNKWKAKVVFRQNRHINYLINYPENPDSWISCRCCYM